MQTDSCEAKEAEQLPPPKPEQTVIVITKRFKCVGHIDTQGMWHRLYGKRNLPEVIGWERI